MLRTSNIPTINPKLPIPHEDWNMAVEEYRRNRPLVCGSKADGGWRHPWKPSLEWDGTLEVWRVTIKPGFVNGGEVETVMNLSESPDLTKARAKADESILIGKTRVAARLSEEPGIPIRAWRSIGPDANSTGLTLNSTATGGTVNYESVPAFFLAMGVGGPPVQKFSTTSGITTQVGGTDKSDERLLRAVEVVLVKSRPAVISEWTLGAGLNDNSIAQFDVVYAGAVEVDETPRIDVRTSYSPLDPQDPLDRLKGNWQDEGRDELHICTLYLVSPPGADLGSKPDSTWDTFHQSHVFWNLNHATNILPVTEEPTPLRFPIPLANGIAQGLINSIVADLNDRYDAALEFVNNRSLEGRFWTT